MAHHKLNYLDGSIKSFLRIHGYHAHRKPNDQAKCVGKELRERGSTGSREEQQKALAEAARKCKENKGGIG